MLYFFAAASDERFFDNEPSLIHSSLQMIRPSTADFVEVIRGGELAADIIISTNLKVPESGYLVLTIGENPIIMCPRASDNISDCPNAEENLPDVIRFTFFNIELDPQKICVEFFNWDRQQTGQNCSTLVASENFMGRRESRSYFAENAVEFVSSIAIKSLWRAVMLRSSIKSSCSVR